MIAAPPRRLGRPAQVKVADEWVAAEVRTEAIAVEMRPSEGVTAASVAARTPAHWRCGSCGAPCWCDGDARLLPHADCGLAR